MKIYPYPCRILRNGPATIILFDDGSRSVVKLQDGDEDDPYTAVCAAVAKRFIGSGSRIKELVEKTEYIGESSRGLTKKKSTVKSWRESRKPIFPDIEELFNELFERS